MTEIQIQISKRLKEVRKALGLNQTEFAKQLGLTQTFLSMIEGAKNPLTGKNIKLVCSTFNVNENWLRTGKGDMFSSLPYEKEFHDIFQKLMPETQKYLALMARELLHTQNRLLTRTNNEHSDDSPEEPEE